MAIPQTSDSLGNVLRLQGLKNVKRRVIPGAEFLENLTPPDTDVSGTSGDMTPPPNLPAMETGAEPAPQSFDVRANQVISEEPSPAPMESGEPEEESIWTRFGRALAMQAGHAPSQKSVASTPPIATEQVEASEGLPPVSSSEEVAAGQELPQSANSTFWSGIGNALKDYVSPTKRREMGEQNKTLLEDAQMMAQGLKPEEERARVAAEKQATQASLQEQLNKAQENPLETVVHGATDQFANTPELQKDFSIYTGIDVTPQMTEMTAKYENILNDLENNLNQEGAGYDEQSQRIKERILSNQSSDMDKYYIGLALLMPLIVGGFFGKEAGLGALGGTTQGLAEAFGRRVNDIRKDEELLADVNKNQSLLNVKRSELDLQRAQIPEQVRKNLPADEREFVKGRGEVKWKDPLTGQQKAGIEVKPGLVALPQFLTNKEDLKEMTKAANELRPVLNYTKELNNITDTISKILPQIRDPDSFTKAIVAGIGGRLPAGYLSKITDEVELDGRKVNAGVELENQIGLLSNAYAQAQKLGQLDRAAQAHMEKIISNPTKTLTTPQDTLNQIISIRNLVQNKLINDVENAGFAPEIVIDELGKQNRKFFGQLNKREEEKQSSELLRE